MAVLVTGAAGFIGSNLVRHLLERWSHRQIVSFDLLTYSGNLLSLDSVLGHPNHTFVKGDICDRDAVRSVFEDYEIDGVIHLAAESHVDRSIVDPMAFVRTNVDGTVTLLQEAANAWGDREDVRFQHVSTDEVFGSLGSIGSFHEETPYSPRSPYSASKAASDHFVRAWNETYGLDVVLTNCTNNYGPYQFPEKLIPVVLTRAMEDRDVPVYGTGTNVRDWLFVEDHCDALATVFDEGKSGETYCVGGEAEVSNLDLVYSILDEFDEATGNEVGKSRELVSFVEDRPGHDFRYAMDIGKIRRELGWQPSVTLKEGLARTVRWYLDNGPWLDAVSGGEHREFEKMWYQDRAGNL